MPADVLRLLGEDERVQAREIRDRLQVCARIAGSPPPDAAPPGLGPAALAGPREVREPVGRVNAAIAHMLTARGMDHAFGARIPALLREGRLQWSAVENEAPVAKPIAAMMQMSG